MGIDDVPTTDELDAYRLEAREWLAENMSPLDPQANPNEQSKERLKELGQRLHRGGYSGICFPTELGGAGLGRHHHRVFCEEAADYELPVYLGNPGLSIIAPPIMEFGTAEQTEHVTAMIRGERLFVQLMSEPSGGSDMAGALTRPTATATRGSSTDRRSGVRGRGGPTGGSSSCAPTGTCPSTVASVCSCSI